jgi:predicted ATPase
MNGFKLLAIIPLKDCHSKFRKNLQIGLPYKLYDDYEIKVDKNSSKIISASCTNKNNFDDLYNLHNGIKINISAIVGLNGSGKSTLIELLYLFVYKLGLNKLQNEEPFFLLHSDKLEKELEIIRYDFQELKRSQNSEQFANYLQNKHKLLIKEYSEINPTNYVSKISNLLEEESQKKYKQIQDDKKMELLILRKLNVGLVYENVNGIFSVQFNGSQFSYNCLNKYNDYNDNFNLNELFYTISLNFSHHSLNSSTLGNWLNNLFHKNDAYTAPVVINPMREKGNYNINRELYLSNERLMSNVAYNIVQNKEFKLLGKYKIINLIYRTKKSIKQIRKDGINSKFDRLLKPYLFSYYKEDFDSLSSVKLLKAKAGIDLIDDFSPFLDYAIGYLEEKIEKLKNQYFQFFLNEKGEFDNIYFDNYLLNDNSHITKKIRQTVNFLKYSYKKDTPWDNSTSYLSNHMSITNFKTWIQKCSENYLDLSPLDLMDFALPGFFNIDFELRSPTGNKLFLSQLSSGEQQMIFNINSIVYHLYNLQSIHPKKGSKFSDNRIKYKNINILLDEIELYYHPDMQRELIKNLLESLELIKNKDELGIESINICFLTHSPFILSDIPKSNILRLSLDEKGKSIIEKNSRETFGANIHDLLANDFFLSNSIGSFALENINSIIDFHNNLPREKKNTTFQKLKVDYENKKNIFLFLESNIGDDLIRHIIKNHIDFIQDYFENNEEN